MKFIKTAFIGFLRGSSFLSGKWYQMMTSRYVADTIQLGQKCNIWNFTQEEGTNKWNLHQTSHLHYMTGFDMEKDTTLWTKLKNEKFVLQDSDWFSPDLWIKNKTEDVLMLMGLDNLTFYILARDPNEFESNHRMDVMALLNLWDYDTYYKTPITSYELECE